MKATKRLYRLILVLTLVVVTALVAAACHQHDEGGDQSGSQTTTTSTDTSTSAKATYAVTFNTDGGTAVAGQTVTEGDKASKPDAPEKAGHAFVGWYADSGYKTVYDFNSAVTGSTMIYARFVEIKETEFTATYYVDGQVFTTGSTYSGRLYNMPVPEKAGDKFVGWWLSDYDDADKLTAKYDDRELKQDVALYAVWESDGDVISITETNVSWQSKGVNQTYYVTVTDPDGQSYVFPTQQNYILYDFSSFAAGDYEVSVRIGRVTAVGYYKNKALAKPSNYKVEGNVMYFNAVEGATDYSLYVTYGNDLTKTVDLGNDNFYDFSSLDMRKGGIIFAVTAKADGYMQATSVFSFERNLGAVTGFAIDGQGCLTWNAVENADNYSVTVAGDTFFTTATEYSLKPYAGTFNVTVTAYAKGYNASAADYAYAKSELATPAGLTIEGTTFKWNAVDGATGYTVKINGIEYACPTNEFNLSGLTSDVTVSVKATGAKDSYYSDAITVTTGAVTGLRYENGKVYWNAAYGVDAYTVKVNDGEAVPVTGNSAPVTFTKAGVNTVTVSFEGGSAQSVEVTAYAVNYNANGGEEVATEYHAAGDMFTPKTTSFDGRVFGGWYTTENITPGENLYADTFFAANALDLYAYWTYADIDVTLVNGNGYDNSYVKVTYNSNYKLPVLTSKDGLKLFTGWYTEDNSEGVKIADEKGNYVNEWDLLTTTELFAGWLEILKVNEIENGAAYSIEAGRFISYVRTITIPETVNGKPVTYIENNAFDSLNLTEINIPDTIKTIEFYPTTASFRDLYYLRNVNVYETENPDKGGYFSEDGILYYNNTVSERPGVELRFVPLGKGGVLDIPDFVEILPWRAVTYSSFYEIHIPSSVWYVDAQALCFNQNLFKVVFEPTPAGKDELPLTIGDWAFYTCLKLEEITLPKRLSTLAYDTDSGRFRVFENTPKLAAINVEEGCTAYTSKSGLLCNANGTEIIYAPQGYETANGTFTVPAGVQRIADYAFVKPSYIKTLIVPGYVSYIGKYAFAMTDASTSTITSITFEGVSDDRTLTIDEHAFYGQANLTEVSIPANVTSIGKGAFGNTARLIKVTVDSYGAINYASGAFLDDSGKSYIRELNIGKNVGDVSSIAGVFGTDYLRKVNVDPENTNYYSTTETDDGFGGVVYDYSKTRILFFPNAIQGEYNLLPTVTEIPDNVFAGRTGLSAVTIGSNVTSIGANAFKGCTMLSSVTFADGGTAGLSIGANAFEGCTSLASFVISSRVTSVGASAFKGTTALHSVTFELGGTEALTIGANAFSDSSSSSSTGGGLVIGGVKPGTGGTTTYTCNINGALTIPARTTSIGNYAFAGASGISALNFEDGGTAALTIGNYAFKDLAASAVSLPARTTGLGTYAFDGAKMSTLSLNEGLTSIGDYAFNGCTNITSVTVPSTVTTMGTSTSFMVFAGCTALTEVTVAEGNTAFTAAGGAIYSLTGGTATKLLFAVPGVENVVIPATVTTISDNAFSGNTAVKTVSFASDTVSGLTIGAKAFFGCTALETVTLPSGVTQIGNFAFKNCSALTTINIPNTVTKICRGAFFDCESLANVTFEDGGDASLVIEGSTASLLGSSEWGGVFSGSGVEEITFPARTTEIGANAFSDSRTTGVTSNPTSKQTKLKKVTFKATAEGKALTIGNYAFSYSLLDTITFENGVNLTTIGQYAFRNTLITSISLPATVTTINTYAFYGCADLASVTLPDGALATIGNYAFAGTALTSFSFPETTVDKLTIGNNIFNGCNSLTHLYLSSKVTSLTGLFDGCTTISTIDVSPDNTNLILVNGVIYNATKTSILAVAGQVVGALELPEGVTEIGEGAFRGHTQMTSLSIPATMLTIGASAFRECTALTTVTIADNSSLVALYDYVFAGDKALENFTFGENSKVTYLGKYAFQACNVKKMTIPAGVTAIQEGTFMATSVSSGNITDPNGLEEISFLGNVVSFGNYAFMGSKLKEMTIPDTVTSFGYNPFNDCQWMTKLVLGAHQPAFTSGTAYFSNLYELTEVVIPEGWTTIPSYMFSGAAKLETVNLPSTITTIESYAFRNATSLKSIALPAGLTTLGNNAFEGCSLITSITLPAGVTAIPNYAFAKTGLTSMTFGDTVTSVGTYVFQNCASLESVTFGANVESLGTAAFYNCTSLKTVTLSDKITTIPSNAFYGTSLLETVTLPASTSTIAANAFNKSGVQEVRMGALVSSIASGAFTACTRLESFVVSEDNPYFRSDDSGILYDSDGTLLIFPAGKSGEVTLAAGTTLGNAVFSGCTLVTKVVLPSDATAVPQETFKGCTGLVEVVIPASVTNIGQSAFEGCSALTTVNIPANVTNIGKYAFKGCTVMGNVTLPDGLTALGAYAFQNAKAITTITVPAGITTIDANTFDGCSELTSVTLPSTLTTLCADAFKDCTKISELHLPASFNNITKGNQDSSGGGIGGIVIGGGGGISIGGGGRPGIGGGGTTTETYNPFTNWTAAQTIYLPYANADALPAALAVLKDATKVKATIVYAG